MRGVGIRDRCKWYTALEERLEGRDSSLSLILNDPFYKPLALVIYEHTSNSPAEFAEHINSMVGVTSSEQQMKAFESAVVPNDSLKGRRYGLFQLVLSGAFSAFMVYVLLAGRNAVWQVLVGIGLTLLSAKLFHIVARSLTNLSWEASGAPEMMRDHLAKEGLA